MCPIAANVEREIEFVGGPFDGHWHRHHLPDDRLPQEVVWLVSDDAFRQIGCWAPTQMSWPTLGSLSSVVLYKLDCFEALPKYRYAGAISAENFDAAISGIG